MFQLTPAGFFEDTLENSVRLFEYVYRGTDFNLKMLKDVPFDVKQGVITQYYEKPRTIEEYCEYVWNNHESAQKIVAE